MAWGGSLNEKGSDYIRKLKEVDTIIKFLENLKKELNQKEKNNIQKTIEILVNFFIKDSKEEV